MNFNNKESDQEILEKLREQSQKLLRLEKQIMQLEIDREKLKCSNEDLNDLLQSYLEEQKDWEWFFNNSLDMLCVASIEGYFVRVNPAFTKTLGYTESELLSQPFINFIHPEDIENTINELKNLGKGIDCISFENRYKDAKGNWRWLSWCCPAITEKNSKLFGIARDITMKKASEEQLLYKALHDPLTDLFNRSALEFELENAIARINRNPSIHLTLLMIDLDQFKSINDTHGHQVGDKVLKTVAERFKSVQRRNDFVCRLGGDEFVWMLESQQGANSNQLLTKLRNAISKPIKVNNREFQIRCSIGVAHCPEQASTPDKLLELADSAMYQEKFSQRRDSI